jgi:pimeloyl-ACP methyl ester carboxylesterase
VTAPAAAGTLETVVSADGTRIAFDRIGAGPPLLLLPGALCDRNTFAPLARLLAPDFEVFDVDRRGRGDSGDTAPYAVAREVEDIAAVIEAAGGRAAVFGHSSGAALALEAAASGLPVSRLVLFEPPYQLDPAENRQSTDLADRYAALVAAGRRGDAVELFMSVVGLPPEAIAGARSQPFWSSVEGIAHTLAYDASVMGDGTLPAARAAAVAVPTLVVDGGASPPWAGRSAEALVATIPNATRQTIPGQDHNIAPEAIGAAVRDWLLTGS